MSKNKKNGGKQASAQQHAEGQHGRKTIDFLRKQHNGDRHDHALDAPRKRAERQSSAKRKGS